MTIYERIYDLVATIPPGKVLTYGDIAQLANTHPRVVGNALHRNPSPQTVPCHRVVNQKGHVATAYAFGGKDAHIQRLATEGVLCANGTVDVTLYRAIELLQDTKSLCSS